MSTKDLILQDVMMYEGLYKITTLLNQFCDGLKRSGVYDVIAAYPDIFSTLFTYAELTPVDVVEAVYVDQDDVHDDDMIISHLVRYIHECDESGTCICIYNYVDNVIGVNHCYK